MPLFPQALLNPGVQKREVFGWAMYDFANSGYTMVIHTAVFNAYFVGVVDYNADWAMLAWTLTLTASNALVVLFMPALGAWGDLHGAKKKLLAAATAGCVLGCDLLAACGRGDVALTAAFLSKLARRDGMGRVSGWGWSFGYFGGMLTLGLSLGYVLRAQAQG